MSQDLQGRLLEEIERGGVLNDVPSVGGASRDELLAATNLLLDSGWVSAVPNHGDGRLLAVRKLQITDAGKTALQGLLKHQGGTQVQSAHATSLELKLQNRLELMTAIYKATDGSTNSPVNVYDLGDELGLDRDTTNMTFEHLEGEGLVEYLTMDGGVRLTHEGVIEIERVITDPESPTEHFPATGNVINVHQMIGSHIIQGSPGSSISMAELDVDLISSLLADVRELLPNLDMSTDDDSELKAELATAEAQLGSSRPRPRVVVDALRSIAALLSGVDATVAIAPKAAELAQFLLETLPNI